MTPDVSRQFGINVRAARERLELSQEELAARSNKHKDTISLIERGKSLPSIKSVYELAEALGVGITDLLPPGAEPKRSPLRAKLEAEIRELVRTTPDKRLELVRDQIALLTKHDERR